MSRPSYSSTRSHEPDETDSPDEETGALHALESLRIDELRLQYETERLESASDDETSALRRAQIQLKGAQLERRRRLLVELTRLGVHTDDKEYTLDHFLESVMEARRKPEANGEDCAEADPAP